MFSCGVGVKGRGAISPPARDRRGGDERLQHGNGRDRQLHAARVAVKIAKATQGTMSLIGSVRNLPMVNGARLSLAAFPRLQKITPRSTIQTSRLRELRLRECGGRPCRTTSHTTGRARETRVTAACRATRDSDAKASVLACAWRTRARGGMGATQSRLMRGRRLFAVSTLHADGNGASSSRAGRAADGMGHRAADEQWWRNAKIGGRLFRRQLIVF